MNRLDGKVTRRLLGHLRLHVGRVLHRSGLDRQILPHALIEASTSVHASVHSCVCQEDIVGAFSHRAPHPLLDTLAVHCEFHLTEGRAAAVLLLHEIHLALRVTTALDVGMACPRATVRISVAAWLVRQVVCAGIAQETLGTVDVVDKDALAPRHSACC